MADSREAPPLARKLGIRAGARVAAICPPPGFRRVLGDLPPGVRLVKWPQRHSDVIVLFADTRPDLQVRFDEALPALAVDGGLWICYPKRASGVATELGFDNVQRTGLDAGLVDNKSASIDATWTGVRFVVPLAARQTWAARQVGVGISASRGASAAAPAGRRRSSALRGGPTRRR